MSAEIILYQPNDALTNVQLRAEDGSVSLSRVEIAELFAATKQNVNLNVKNILNEGELGRQATINESLAVRTEGGRQVRRTTPLSSIATYRSLSKR